MSNRGIILLGLTLLGLYSLGNWMGGENLLALFFAIVVIGFLVKQAVN